MKNALLNNEANKQIIDQKKEILKNLIINSKDDIDNLENIFRKLYEENNKGD